MNYQENIIDKEKKDDIFDKIENIIEDDCNKKEGM